MIKKIITLLIFVLLFTGCTSMHVPEKIPQVNYCKQYEGLSNVEMRFQNNRWEVKLGDTWIPQETIKSNCRETNS